MDYNSVSSEAIALNCAIASGIVADFLEEEDLLATVSGRMGSGSFQFNLTNTMLGKPCDIEVHNSQIEIDAAYEGVRSLSLFEAKRELSEDFLVRQLYYPYRLWKKRLSKPVRPLFLVYSNGIYRLYEYMFQEPNNYNSLVLIKQKNYSLEDTAISVADIQSVMSSARNVTEPKIPFPQANFFERVLNLCELLNDQELTRNDVTNRYAFDARQTNYYTDAARYLGLLEKRKEGVNPSYALTKKGARILRLSYKQRQLAYCKCILSHSAFNNTLRQYFKTGNMPMTGDIIEIMKQSNLYGVRSERTYERRSSTIKGWINWMIGLINE